MYIKKCKKIHQFEHIKIKENIIIQRSSLRNCVNTFDVISSRDDSLCLYLN